MTSNFERFQEIQKQADSESYSSLCHLEPKKAPKLSNLAPLWSGPLFTNLSKFKEIQEGSIWVHKKETKEIRLKLYNCIYSDLWFVQWMKKVAASSVPRAHNWWDTWQRSIRGKLCEWPSLAYEISVCSGGSGSSSSSFQCVWNYGSSSHS